MIESSVELPGAQFRHMPVPLYLPVPGWASTDDWWRGLPLATRALLDCRDHDHPARLARCVHEASLQALGERESLILVDVVAALLERPPPDDPVYARLEGEVQDGAAPAVLALWWAANAAAMLSHRRTQLAEERLQVALRHAQQARDTLVDAILFELVGDYNHLHGHFDAAELAYERACGTASPGAPDQRTTRLTLHLCMLDVARGNLSQARLRQATVLAHVLRGSPRLAHFNRWVELLAGKVAPGRSISMLVAPDDQRLRDVLRRRFLTSRHGGLESVDGVIDLLEVTRTDPASGLPITLALRGCLELALESASTVQLALIEIRDLSGAMSKLEVNLANDLLRLLCARMAAALGPTQVFGRAAFSRFAAVSTGSLVEFRDELELLQDALAEWILVDGALASFQARVALTVAAPADSAYSMWARAIDALNDQDWGAYTLRVIEADRSARATQSFTLVQAARSPSFDLEMLVLYQPVVDARSGQLHGAEALARWNSASGLLQPESFISVFESSGQIVDFGRSQAVRAIEDLRRFLRQRETFSLNLNKSALEFARTDLPDFLMALCLSHGVHPSRLRLEITESTLLENSGAAKANVLRLQSHGFKCLLDDFGTGFSNLSQLVQLNSVDLKIDGQFVRGLTDHPGAAAVCQLIIKAANMLKVEVVAEHVETLEQARWLLDNGCHLHQGFLYSHPVAADQLAEWIDTPPAHWKTGAPL